MRHRVLAVLALLLALAWAVERPLAPELCRTLSTLPITITKDNDCARLYKDLHWYGDTPAINVQAARFQLQFNGHEIHVHNACGSAMIITGAHASAIVFSPIMSTPEPSMCAGSRGIWVENGGRVAVYNGILTNFGFAINAWGDSYLRVEDTYVDGVTLFGISCGETLGCIIKTTIVNVSSASDLCSAIVVGGNGGELDDVTVYNSNFYGIRVNATGQTDMNKIRVTGSATLIAVSSPSVVSMTDIHTWDPNEDASHIDVSEVVTMYIKEWQARGGFIGLHLDYAGLNFRSLTLTDSVIDSFQIGFAGYDFTNNVVIRSTTISQCCTGVLAELDVTNLQVRDCNFEANGKSLDIFTPNFQESGNMYSPDLNDC